MSSRPNSSALPPRPRPTPITPPTHSPIQFLSPAHINPSPSSAIKSLPESLPLTPPSTPTNFLSASGSAEPDLVYLRTAETELLEEIRTLREQLNLSRTQIALSKNRRLRRTSSIGNEDIAIRQTNAKQPSTNEKPITRRIISVTFRLPIARERSTTPHQLFNTASASTAIFSLSNAAQQPFVWVGAPSSSMATAATTSSSTPSSPRACSRSVAFDYPPVEKSYRERRHSRYSFNRDRNQNPMESRSVVVSLPEEPEVMERFDIFCEQILWKLLHYDYSSIGHGSVFDEYFTSYKIVNQRFAEAISEIYEDGDLIWVHNYQLMLLPRMLRERLWYAKIGFFLYTPFPSAEIFRILPYRTEILRGLIGADLIGFHSYDYSKQFVASCSRLLGIDGTPSLIEADPSTGRRCELGIYPAGIDARTLKNYVSSKPVKSRVVELRARFEGLKIVVGIDRLDDIFCGIPLKLLAFEQLLLDNPHLIGKVVLVQVATLPRQARSTAVFRQQQMEVNEFVGRINSAFGTFSFTPIHYINSELEAIDLYALISIGHVCVVSTVRDGMGLIPHEWTVCQHGGYKGPIVLSEFAGAAHSFSTALHVNPWNVDDMAAKIKRALDMDEKERAMRNDAAYSFVSTHTAKLWGLNFLEDLEHCETVNIGGNVTPTSMLDTTAVLHAYLGLAAMTSSMSASTMLASGGPLQSTSLSFGNAGRVPTFQTDERSGIEEIASRINSSLTPTKADTSVASVESSISKLRSRAALFVLDLDGTMMPFQAIAQLGAPTNSVIDALQGILDASPRNYVLVTSSRDPSTVRKWLGDLDVYLAAEDGAFFRAPGDTKWTSLSQSTSGRDFHVSRNVCPQGSILDSISIGSSYADGETKGQGQQNKDDAQRKKRMLSSQTSAEANQESIDSKKERKGAALQDGHHRYTSNSFNSMSSNDSLPNGDFNLLQSWKSLVMPAIQHFAERTPGVVIEVGEVTVTWHYIDSDTDFGRWQARDLHKHLESFLLQRLNIDLLSDSHRRWIKVRPKGVDKTMAVSRTIKHMMTRERHDVDVGNREGQTALKEPLYIDFVLCVGDDKTDESIFDMMKDVTQLESLGIRATNRVFTCRVGTPVSAASAYVESPARVIELLQEFGKINVRST